MLGNSKILQILLIDDDREDYLTLKDILAEQAGEVGFPYLRLEWVSTYEAGLQAFDANRHDVYLVDYHLGGKSGTDLIGEAHLRGVEAPIIILTGHGSYQVDLTAMQLGASDYLVKSQLTLPLLERSIRYSRAQASTKNNLEELVREQTKELVQTVGNLEAEVHRRIESEAKFRVLTNTTSAAILIVRDEKIIFANPAARFVTGYPPEELEGMRFIDLVHPAYHKAAQRSAQAGNWNADLPMRYELKILQKIGAERWVDITSGILDYAGEPALIMTAFDITERDLAERALEQALDRLESEAAERTEDLRQSGDSLDALQAAVAFLVEGLDPSDLFAKMLKAIQCAVPSAGYAWLHLARIGSGQMQPVIVRGLPDTLLSHLPFPHEEEFPTQASASVRPFQADQIHIPLESNTSDQNPGLVIRSMIAAPIEFKGTVIGTLTLASSRPQAFFASDLKVLERFAAASAPAVQKAWELQSG